MAEQIFPTKGNLIACKNLTLAKLGFDLLDRKRNVLMREMMKLIDEAAGMQRPSATRSSRHTKRWRAPISRWASSMPWRAPFPRKRLFRHGTQHHGRGPAHRASGQPASVPLYYGFSGSNAQLDYAYVCFR